MRLYRPGLRLCRIGVLSQGGIGRGLACGGIVQTKLWLRFEGRTTFGGAGAGLTLGLFAQQIGDRGIQAAARGRQIAGGVFLIVVFRHFGQACDRVFGVRAQIMAGFWCIGQVRVRGAGIGGEAFPFIRRPLIRRAIIVLRVILRRVILRRVILQVVIGWLRCGRLSCGRGICDGGFSRGGLIC